MHSRINEDYGICDFFTHVKCLVLVGFGVGGGLGGCDGDLNWFTHEFSRRSVFKVRDGFSSLPSPPKAVVI